jgi:hypothetical protein
MLNDETYSEDLVDDYKLTRYKHGRQSFKCVKINFPTLHDVASNDQSGRPIFGGMYF